MSMSVYEIITNKIIESLEKGTVLWQKKWKFSAYKNFISKKEYNGINRLLLNLSTEENNFSCPFWITFNQASQLKCQIKKGSKATQVIFWKVIDTKKESDKEEVDEKNEKKFVLRYYNVFNLEQTDLDKSKWENLAELNDLSTVSNAEELIKNYQDKPEINVTYTNRACYNFISDTINVPKINQYDKADNYYNTLFHEMIHSTGHSKRLNRDLKGYNEDNESYSFEELVAELGSSYLCNDCNLTPDFDNTVSYISGWLNALKKDSRMIIFASAKAEKACNYIKGMKHGW